MIAWIQIALGIALPVSLVFGPELLTRAIAAGLIVTAGVQIGRRYERARALDQINALSVRLEEVNERLEATSERIDETRDVIGALRERLDGPGGPHRGRPH